MKKKILAIMSSIILSSTLALTACATTNNTQMNVTSFTDSEKALLTKAVDNFYETKLLQDQVYDIKIEQYKAGTLTNSMDIKGVRAIENNDNIFISSLMLDDYNALISVNTPKDNAHQRHIFCSDNASVEQDCVRITGLGQSNVDFELNKEYLMCYIIYKSANSADSVNDAPLKDWSNFNDKQNYLKDFDLCYLVTVKLTNWWFWIWVFADFVDYSYQINNE